MNGEPRAEGREQKIEHRKQQAEDREQKADNRKSKDRQPITHYFLYDLHCITIFIYRD